MRRSVPDEVPTLLKTAEVAEQFKLSMWTVAKMRKSGQLPSVKLGRNIVRFRLEDVEAFLASKVSHAAQPTK
jgi:excisionase family DNA binding protein